tara:strand:- start:162 stop:419 length:258 start_codon:yes stop_codon:yes gene_type:complete
MTEIKDDIKSVIDKNKARTYEKKKQEWEKLENDKSDCLEAIEVLGGAVACGFLDDKHSLILQDWIKYYQNKSEQIENYLDEARKP